MLHEPHYPSPTSVAVVFGVILLLIGGVFAWAFYFNFGSVRLSADKNFTVSVNGDTYSCSTSCDISLPPNTYDFVAQSQGYYDEQFSLEVGRWDHSTLDLSFHLIPYLKAVSVGEIPAEVPEAVVKNVSGKQLLYTIMDGTEKMITEFESLKAPEVRVSSTNAVVVDQGRAFFVELESGRRVRRFDDSVLVRDALVSDEGKRTLFDVASQGDDFLWLWDNELSEVAVLPWYVSAQRMQWDLGQNHRLFVITDQLSDSQQTSFLDQLVQNPEAPKPLALFLYNFDSSEAKLISLMNEKNPLRMFRRGDRYFLEYAGGEFEELVVK